MDPELPPWPSLHHTLANRRPFSSTNLLSITTMHFLYSTLALLSSALSTTALCIDTVDPTILTTQHPLTALKSTNASLVSELYKPSTFVYNSTFGMLKRWNDPEKDVSTFLTFDFPSDSKGKQCTFALFLERWAQVCPDGSAPSGSTCSGKFALFSTLAPATDGGSTPTRDQWIGELQAEAANWASWVQPSSSPKNISCPKPGKATFELVPTGSFDYVYFPASPGAKSFATFLYF
ncbi:hypothetical protein EJ04DRAFT_601508 [Polyplosphaeria fusca]|uniref:Ubiquitin 3 binding protein But2 C-terminal domain-containing protein n=1 Tax=Polyplosphaeria fusca TaxID=682080 RepID=A0A9P4V3E7_9PLEO|nr:hypothetical protein EJ04DRAFT_601508 [Polyplosphaeria fusca]